MQLIWQVSDADIATTKSFLERQVNDALVKGRIKRNVTHRPTSIEKPHFWHAVVACLLTTQQRSGPTSPVSRFLNINPFPLSFELCHGCKSPTELAHKALYDHRGIRFVPKIAAQLEKNLAWLDDRYWPKITDVLHGLVSVDNVTAERAAARFIGREFHGFGPKQSRNLLQMLGLTRYEIPLDSRIVKWFNKFGFPIKLSAGALADEGIYEFLSDGIHELCRRAGVYPCVLDAAIFASFDGNAWNENSDIIW